MFKGSAGEEQAREAAHRLFFAELISSFIDWRSWKCERARDSCVEAEEENDLSKKITTL